MFRSSIIVLLLLSCAAGQIRAAVLHVEFSPDDKWVVAVRQVEPSGCRLVLFDVSEEEQARTLACAESISAVRYSPDGQHICIAARGVKNTRNLRKTADHDGSDVYIVDLDGSGPLRITYQGAASPTYSPTGGAVAYIGQNGEIATIDIEGQNWKIVTRTPPIKTIQTWLADDKSFLAVTIQDGYMARYAFTPPSKHLIRVSLKHAFGRNAVSPKISPDGKTLAYVMGCSSDDMPEMIRVFVQEKDVPRLLSECDDKGCSGIKPGLAWSTSGTQLALSAESVWVINAGTGQMQKLNEEEQPQSLSETPKSPSDPL